MDSFINPNTAELNNRYGYNWRQVPVVYGSLGMSGDDRHQREEEHEKIAADLVPDFRLLSPFRGIGRDSPHNFEVDSPGVMSHGMARARDLSDVRRSIVVLVNMKASTAKRYVVRDTRTDEIVLLVSPLPTTANLYENLGETIVEMPLTGTIAEIIEAHRCQIPVIGYDFDRRSNQMNNPFVADKLSVKFLTWQEATAYLRDNWKL